eukprot:TRINITY_DN35905_c0_g1_i1.p1 TRINITY_DN35905_c0_g1~~TRINITY_DN35905_c0_g1_i1.p1  ORF type:complete len:266 (+),score=58.52 TRINITY_DN35905_c0_g1_i1:245-1042(+)
MGPESSSDSDSAGGSAAQGIPEHGPGSVAANQAAAALASEAVVQAQVDVPVYHCIRDAQNGYALVDAKRIFKFGTGAEELSISMVRFGTGCSWIAAFVLSNAAIYIAHISPSSSMIIATLTGHSKQVTDVAWSQENDLLASVSTDGLVRLWSNPAFECVAVLDLGGSLTSCAFGPAQLSSLEASLVVTTELAEPTWQVESEITVIVLRMDSTDFGDAEVGGSEEAGAVVRTTCFDAERGELLFVGLASGKPVSYTHLTLPTKRIV